MNWINNINSKHTEDPGFRKARIIYISIIILTFILLIWYGKDFIRIPERRTLVVYCFSGMEEVMENGIFPAFQDYWFKQKREKLEYIPTFAGSGVITNKILSRFPAEVAILSSKIDVLRLSTRGISFIQSQKDLPYQGIINRTPIIMIVREGNPKRIVRFSDLGNPGIEIVYPDPHTSGAGQWGILAFYGSIVRESDDELDAFRELKGLWTNIIEQPPSARDVLHQFVQYKGDVLITYESNILKNPNRKQVAGQLIYPPSTIICEPIVLSVEKNVISKQRDLVDAFIQFLWSKEAQQIFVDYGFHSVEEELNLNRIDFVRIQDPFTLDSLGSYLDVKNIIDQVIRNQFSPTMN